MELWIWLEGDVLVQELLDETNCLPVPILLIHLAIFFIKTFNLEQIVLLLKA